MSRASAWRRPLALVLLCERRLRDGFLGRAAGMYGWGIALSYAGLALLAPDSAGALTSRALVSALLTVGLLVAWAALRDLGAERTRDGVTALAREHGVAHGALGLARGAAVLLRLLKTVGAPILALVLVTGTGAPWRGPP